MKLERWAQVSEIIASLGVIVTLIVLAQEARTNTAALQNAAAVQAVSAATIPFLSPETTPRLYAKVKAVDGLDTIGPTRAYMERYGMTIEEAVQWERVAQLTWSPLEQAFAREGPSERPAYAIRGYMSAPDLEL